MPTKAPKPGDIIMMAFPATPDQKLPPYYLFSADTGDVLAGPFEQVTKAVEAARRLARRRGGQAWHKRVGADEHGVAVSMVYPID